MVYLYINIRVECTYDVKVQQHSGKMHVTETLIHRLKTLELAFKNLNSHLVNPWHPDDLALNTVFLIQPSLISDWRYPCTNSKDENYIPL